MRPGGPLGPDGASVALAEADRAVQVGLHAAAEILRRDGILTPAVEGKLLRPLVAYAMVPADRRAGLDTRFWFGALAIQMVHEASLLHDDILDSATHRRGTETTACSDGVGAALVLGDLYLTGAYRAAARTGDAAFLERFIDAVERTVAGEAAQARVAGARVSPQHYEDVVRGKSGALFGAACVLGVSAGGVRSLGEAEEIGRMLGATYQRIDDLLDYCTWFDTGKPPLQDYAQRKWTWVLDLLGEDAPFDLGVGAVARQLFTPAADGPSPAERAVRVLHARRADLVTRSLLLSPGDEIVPAVLDGWIDAAVRAVAEETRGHADAARTAPAQAAVTALTATPVPVPVPLRIPTPLHARTPLDEVRAFASQLGGPERWAAYFGRHAHTFRLAARFFPSGPRETVTGVYAFCRFTDDLVDAPADGAGPERVRARLDAWRELTESAWAGERTGVPVLDAVIGKAPEQGVSRRYPMALLDGVAMDLDRARYGDWSELEAYTFGVAGAVGGWLTQGFGLHDRSLLECAHALGHAMQLTNIARDVGEDARQGRVYLPATLLERHGLSADDLAPFLEPGAPLPDAWPGLMEELLGRADAYYARARPGIRALPGWYRRPVAAAATAYRGIHSEIRRNGYDNLHRRAHTSGPRKVSLAALGVARVLYATPRPWAGLEEATG